MHQMCEDSCSNGPAASASTMGCRELYIEFQLIASLYSYNSTVLFNSYSHDNIIFSQSKSSKNLLLLAAKETGTSLRRL